MTVTPSDATASFSAAQERPTDSPPSPGAARRSATAAEAHPQPDPASGNSSGGDRWLITVVAVTVVAGVVLRFVTRSPLWLDEALSVNIASLPIGEIPEALRHDGHPPLYYVLLHLWIEAFGTGDSAVRALSGIISVATLPLAWVVGRRIGGRTMAWLTLAVFALSPFAARYATETRMYSLVSLLVLGAYLLLDDIVRRDRSDVGRLVLLALVTTALLYSHYWALWLVGATGMVLLFTARRGSGSARAAALRGAGALVAGAVLFTPWLPVMLYQSAHTGTPWASPVRPTSLLGIMITDFGGGGSGTQFSDAQFVGVVIAIGVALAVFGRVVDDRRIELDLRTAPRFRAEAAIVALTLLIAAVFGFVSKSTFASRYASAVLPLVLVMVAGGLLLFTDRRVRVGVLAVVLGLFSLGGIYNVRTDRSQVRQAAESVAAQAKPGDVIVYCPDQLAPSAMRVMPADLETLAFPHLPGDAWPPERVDWVDYADRNTAEAAEIYGRAVADHATPSKAVFVVWAGSYKTHEGVCERLLDGITQRRGGLGDPILGENGGQYFEHMGVVYFPRVGG